MVPGEAFIQAMIADEFLSKCDTEVKDRERFTKVNQYRFGCVVTLCFIYLQGEKFG